MRLFRTPEDREILEFWPHAVATRVSQDLVSVGAAAAPLWSRAAEYWIDLHRKLKASPDLPVVRVLELHPGSSAEPNQFSRSFVATAIDFSTLAERHSASLPDVEALERIAHELVAALAAVHARDILHLDLCPATVAMSGKGLRLLRFGFDARPFIDLRRDNRGYVRPGYSPVEQYDGSRTAADLSPVTDIHAASALLFQLATGAAPPLWTERREGWDGLAGTATAKRLPAALVAAIDAGLAVHPRARPQSAHDWARLFGASVPPPRRAPSPAAVPIGPALSHVSISHLSPPLLGADSDWQFPTGYRPGARTQPWLRGRKLMFVQIAVGAAIALPALAAAYYLWPMRNLQPIPVATPSVQPWAPGPGGTPQPGSTAIASPSPSPVTIDGSYRLDTEADCKVPRVLRRDGNRLHYRHGSASMVLRVIDRTDRSLTARAGSIRQQYTYEPFAGGNRLRMTPLGGTPEIWLRCPTPPVPQSIRGPRS
ncbi:MAG: hypothetical protein WDN24_01365 [Sphingomonas sp.]